MAVFFTNVCKFNQCGSIFNSQSDLIQHIESVHLDFSKENVDKLERNPPEALPFSYVMRCFSENDLQIKNRPLFKAPIGGSLNHAGSSKDKNEDTTIRKINKKYKLNMKNKVPANTSLPKAFTHKPFKCIMPGCRKSYKNISGLKYHVKNGHRGPENYRFQTLQHRLHKKVKLQAIKNEKKKSIIGVYKSTKNNSSAIDIVRAYLPQQKTRIIVPLTEEIANNSLCVVRNSGYFDNKQFELLIRNKNVFMAGRSDNVEISDRSIGTDNILDEPPIEIKPFE